MPVLRFCAALAGGEQMALRFRTAPSSGRPPDRSIPLTGRRIYPVRGEAGRNPGTGRRSFPLPLKFRPEDQRDMEYARMLLLGEKVQATWSGMTAPLPADTAGNLLAQIDAQGELFAFVAEHQETLVVAGGHLPLGVVRR